MTEKHSTDREKSSYIGKINAACDLKLEKNIVFKNGGQQRIKS